MAQLPGIGVFGTGMIVKCLVPILKSSGFNVEAIWAKTKEAAEESAKEMDIAFFTTKADELLLHRNVDLIFIQCPPHLQSPIAIKALGIGKHVVCGLPSGPSQLDALKMLKAAQYYPSLMSLMCNGLRFLPCYIKMKQLVEDGYIGKVTVCEVHIHCGSFLKNKYDWMCDEQMGGGVLNLHGALVIDLLTFLTGQKVVKVNGHLHTFNTQTDKIKGIREISSDDFCSFHLEMKDGTFVVVTINSHVPGDFSQTVLLCGTNGYLKVQGMNLYGKPNADIIEEPIHTDNENVFDVVRAPSRDDKTKSPIPTQHLKGMIKLVESVKEAFMGVEERHGYSRDPLRLGQTFEDGQYVQAVVDAVKQSSKSKNWVKVQIIEEEPDPNMYLSDAVKRTTISYYV